MLSRQILLKPLALISITSMTLACGGNSFEGKRKENKNTAAAESPSPNKGSADATEGKPSVQTQSQSEGDGTTAASTDSTGSTSSNFITDNGQSLSAEDVAFLNSCLADWKTHPFVQQAGDAVSVKIYDLSLSLPIFAAGVSDTQATPAPRLVLVKTALNVLSVVEHRFWNPQGWYCVQNAIDVAADTTFSLHCNAKISTGSGESSDTTNIGSIVEGQTVSQSGTHVLSTVRTTSYCP